MTAQYLNDQSENDRWQSLKKKESHEYQVYNLRTMHQKILDYGK